MENILSRDQLIEKIVYFGDDTDYKIILNLIETLNQSTQTRTVNLNMILTQTWMWTKNSKTKIRSQNKRRKIDKYLYKCFIKAQNIQILLKCTSRESCCGQKERLDIF